MHVLQKLVCILKLNFTSFQLLLGFESLNQPQSQNYGGFPSAYPPQNPSAYAPQNPSAYPPQNSSAYAPQNPSAYPPQQPGYQQSAYSSAPLPAQYNQPQVIYYVSN